MQETYLWYPLEECIPLLDKYRYACFTDPTQSIGGDAPEAEEGLWDDDDYFSVPGGLNLPIV
ncbi:hypothetical protein FA13DRAFT_1733968 [Coprinellus micaceus]|jgi:arginine-tRNA-protein transferase|uniref:Uncharacterized protein n=1 Tax=Coprinellus micaceus TaxID=71717 RepID=A0A4Y7T874_COPMI|nr:hypothetical protein FA13DRAFT_1733968 [Coprinellus micaceus]